MIWIGIDDTDTLDHPGTNKLARKIVDSVAADFEGRLILRHQLLEDPRVPCTLKNGCASILLAPRGTASLDDLVATVRRIVVDWCPVGSDPGLCVTDNVPDAVIAFGRRCQRELIAQQEARRLAADEGMYLEGLGGTQDGVIGALAAVGLAATRDDGRVIYHGASQVDLFDISGPQPVELLAERGVNEVLCLDSGDIVRQGVVDVGKRLRPNYRGGRVVLFVTTAQTQPEAVQWEAVRLT